MDSTTKPGQAGPQEPVIQRGDETSASNYEKVVREELARVQERLAKLAAASPPPASTSDTKLASAALDPNITSFRPTAVDATGLPGELRSTKRGLMRSAAGLLAATGIVGAALAWSSYGEAARATIETWSPELASIVTLASEKLGLSKPPNEPASSDTSSPQAPVADGTAAQPPADAAPTQATAQDSTQAAAAATSVVAPAAATPETAQLLQGMARDIASLTQGIEQLKSSQEQLLQENAKLAEQLKSNQEQMARLVAHASEPSLHPRPVAPKPAVAAVHRPPTTTLPPPQMIAPQAAALPPAPAPLAADEAPPYVPRPPKPVP
jgi:hypothetical protein